MKTAVALLAAALVLAACGGSSDADEPAATSQPSSTPSSTSAEPTDAEPSEESAAGSGLSVTIKDGRVSPQGERVEVGVGDEIVLEVTSDADEELHVHSDPEHTFEVEAGDIGRQFSFTVETPGQVAVEGHHLGVTILQLVVRP